MKRVAVLLLLDLPLASCGTSPTGPSTLQGVVWKLVTLEKAGSTVTIADPTHFTVQFGAEGTLGIRADCNNCFGRYEVTGQALRVVGGLGCTLVYCPSEPVDFEFTSALTAVTSMELKDGRLALFGPNGTLRFRP